MRQLVELNKNLQAFTDMGATIVAISSDAQNQTQALAKRIQPGFSLISDPDDALARRYAASIKGAALYFVRPDGRIQYGYTDPANTLDRPPLHLVVALAREAGDPKSVPRTSEFDAPCKPHKGAWLCPESP